MKDRIPEEFYKGKMEKPVANNVGELIVQLRRLPSEMKLEGTFGGNGLKLTVYNASTISPILEIGDADQ